jgi:hypothetical protein
MRFPIVLLAAWWWGNFRAQILPVLEEKTKNSRPEQIYVPIRLINS